MGVQTDLFAQVDPDEGRERVLAADLSVLLTTRVGMSLQPGELRGAAVDLGRQVATLARERFLSEDEVKERFFALEAAIVLTARLDRPLSEADAQSAAAGLGKRLAAMARRRFSRVATKNKKLT